MNIQRNALLLSVVDREDYWIMSGLVFKVDNTENYESAFNEIVHRLKETDTINFIHAKACNDKLGEFVDVTRDYGTVRFEFENDAVYYQLDFITVL